MRTKRCKCDMNQGITLDLSDAKLENLHSGTRQFHKGHPD